MADDMSYSTGHVGAIGGDEGVDGGVDGVCDATAIEKSAATTAHDRLRGVMDSQTAVRVASGDATSLLVPHLGRAWVAISSFPVKLVAKFWR